MGVKGVCTVQEAEGVRTGLRLGGSCYWGIKSVWDQRWQCWDKAASGGKGEASPGCMGRKKKAQGHEGCTETNSIKSRDFSFLPTFKRSAAY